jgi:hypothetical protein
MKLEYNEIVHYLFIDFKKGYDSREKYYTIFSTFWTTFTDHNVSKYVYVNISVIIFLVQQV